MHILETSIDYLKGVGPNRAKLLKNELKIFTYLDLLSHFPFRYIDKSQFYKINQLHDNMPDIQIKGRIVKFEEKGSKRTKRLIAYLKDETGIVELVWFKTFHWLRTNIKLNSEYIVFGKPNFFNGNFSIPHPELDLPDKKLLSEFLSPVYRSTEKLSAIGLHSRGISKIVKQLILILNNHLNETLSENIISKLNLPSREEAFFHIHYPKNLKSLKRAQKRLKFEEFFFLQLHLLKMKNIRLKKAKGFPFNHLGSLFNEFYENHLPFTLTSAQKRVVREIRNDLKNPQQMNRLLQGDVGSGKTLVAILIMLIAVDNNYQACLMAPTEILAQQHFKTISKYLKDLNINVALLTGSTKTKHRKSLYSNLLNGDINLLIGTHALLEDSVKFNCLGLVVIDEQHRFGVAQRSKLWKKNAYPPHVLVMTATPIPRTLSMTVYGDLDISIIDELPPGRKDIKTIWRTDSSRLKILNFIKQQIHLGRQIYIVFPLIEESEKLDYKNLIDGYNSLLREFPLPEFQVSVVHGKMKPEDKEYEMQRFIEGVTDIMVATTVIEVGVNVPNASVMIIESAERFGLSQLHQLRGRVGRGAKQSYCILVSGDNLSYDAKTRMQTMVDSNDGFKISEVDLELRGPGDIMGTKQSGILDFKIADIVVDKNILDFARKEAILLLKDDENLDKVENINLARAYSSYYRERMQWSRIS